MKVHPVIQSNLIFNKKYINSFEKIHVLSGGQFFLQSYESILKYIIIRILNASAVECWSMLLIDTLDQHPNQCSVDTLWTFKLDQQLVDSWSSVSQLIWIIDWKLVDSQTTIDQDVSGTSI